MDFASLTSAVDTRYSCRNYSAPLTNDDAARLSAFFADFSLPFPSSARVSLHSCAGNDALAKFKGQSHYAAIVAPASDEGRLQTGFAGELAALAADQLGIGSCWVALFNHSAVYKDVFGEAAPASTEIDCVLTLGRKPEQSGAVQRKRKSVDECLHKQSLTAFPQPIRAALECATQAPSAVNFQTWYFWVSQAADGYTVEVGRMKHLIGDKNAHTFTNAGIAASHVYLSLVAQGIPCTVSLQKSDGAPVFRFALKLG